MNSKEEKDDTNISFEQTSYPPPYFPPQNSGQQPCGPISLQPQVVCSVNNSIPITISQQFETVGALLDGLANHSTLFLKQLVPFGQSSIHMLHICDERQTHIYNVCLNTVSFSNRGVGTNSGRHFTSLTNYTITDSSGRIVLEFEESGDGGYVKSGGFSLGVVTGATGCSTEMTATASSGFQTFHLQGQGSFLCPFGITSFSVKSNGSEVGSFEKVSKGVMKINFCNDLDAKANGLLIALSLKTYIDYAGHGCGCCSSGRKGGGAMLCYGICSVFVIFVIIIVTVMVVLLTKS